jgi:hypothetical protein
MTRSQSYRCPLVAANNTVQEKQFTSTEVERKVTFVLEKGQTRFVKFSVSMGFFVGHVYGELVDSAVGLEEIKECKYTGSDESSR